MRVFFLCCFCICCSIAFARGNGEIQNNLKDSVDRTKEITEGAASQDSIPEPEMDTISKAQFLKYKHAYRSPLDTSLRSVLVSDTTYVVHTCCSNLHYKNEKTLTIDTSHGYLDIHGSYSNYQGYDAQLKMYFLESWGVGEFSIGSNFIIDAATNTRYHLWANSDGAYSAPVISMNHKKIVFHMSDPLMTSGPENMVHSEIYVINVSDSASTHHLTGQIMLLLNKVEIKEIVWVNDSTLAVEVDPDWQETMRLCGEGVIRNVNQYLKVYLRPRKENEE